MRTTLLNTAFSLLAIVLVSACSTMEETFPPKEAEYKTKGRTGPALEIPPDLSADTIEDEMIIPEATTASEYSAGGSRTVLEEAAVLPAQAGMKIERDGDKRWLVINGSPQAVWPKIREYWLQTGFLIDYENPNAGVMQTDWAENRADIPEGGVRKLLGKVVEFAYSAATRDRFTTRIEHGEVQGTTEVFLTHYGVEEVVEAGDEGEYTSAVWRPRPNDPELEAAMLQRMMIYLGTEEDKAKRMVARAKDQSRDVRMYKGDDGEAWLVVGEEFSRAWRNTGIALDRTGFTVEDRNRSEGTYYVRYDDPLSQQSSGVLSKLAFWKDDEKPSEDPYQVRLMGEADGTRISIKDKNGNPDKSATARRILTLLQEQLQR
jgi:outer membrane protein assembly factor BamC